MIQLGFSAAAYGWTIPSLRVGAVKTFLSATALQPWPALGGRGFVGLAIFSLWPIKLPLAADIGSGGPGAAS